MIYITFTPGEGLIAVEDKLERYAPDGVTLFHVRGIAKHIRDGVVFGVVKGSESDFTTWQEANPTYAYVVEDSSTYFDFGDQLEAVRPEPPEEGFELDYSALHWRHTWAPLGISKFDGVLEFTQDPLSYADPVALYTWQLESLKQARFDSIDNKTRELIAGGFEYPAASGNMFSLSVEAQNKWTNMYVGRDILSYPITVTTMDEATDTSLADSSDVTAFYTAMITTARAHIDSGRELKNTLRDASTPTEEDILTTAADER